MDKGKLKNILLITLDQCRYDWLDHRKQIVRLPTIRRLSKRGILFTHCYTNSPQCIPARMSWLTGLQPSQMGVTENCEARLAGDAPSMVRDLRNKGWHTELIGKTHWTSHQNGEDLRNNKDLLKTLGFNRSVEIAGPRAMQRMKCKLRDDWEKAKVLEQHLDDLRSRYQRGRTKSAWEVRPSVLPNHLYPDIWITNKAINRLNHMPIDKRWMMWVSYVGPHEPFDTPIPWHGNNVKSDLPNAQKRASWINELPDDCKLKDIALSWDNLLDTKSITEVRRDYADHLQLLDAQIGRIIKHLKVRDDWHDTSILLTSDHGEMLGDQNMLYKSTFLESSIRVPMIYIPSGNEKESASIVETTVSLTKTLRNIMLGIGNQENQLTILRNCTKEKYVTVEYGSEILIVKGGIKACFNQAGKMLWATKASYDGENENILESKKSNTKDKLKLTQIKIIGLKEVRKRSRKNWIWKDIKVRK